MATTRASAARAVVSHTLNSLIFLTLDDCNENDELTSIGINRSLKKPFLKKLLASAESIGRPIDIEKLEERLRGAKKLADLNGAVAESLSRPTKESRSKSIAEAFSAERFTSSEVMAHVCIVIGHFKNIDPLLIKPSDNLKSKWFFDNFEKRAISQSINLYFQNRLGHSLNPLIHPSETEQAITAFDLGQITFNHI